MKGTIYWCNTIESARELFKDLEEKGVHWASGTPLSRDFIYPHGSETCYRVDKYGELHYGSKNFYEECGFEINYQYSSMSIKKLLLERSSV